MRHKHHPALLRLLTYLLTYLLPVALCAALGTCLRWLLNNYVDPVHCRAEMYAGRVSCCFLMSHGEYADWTDRQTNGWTLDHYITPSAIDERCPPSASISLNFIGAIQIVLLLLPRRSDRRGPGAGGGRRQTTGADRLLAGVGGCLLYTSPSPRDS